MKKFTMENRLRPCEHQHGGSLSLMGDPLPAGWRQLCNRMRAESWPTLCCDHNQHVTVERFCATAYARTLICMLSAAATAAFVDVESFTTALTLVSLLRMMTMMSVERNWCQVYHYHSLRLA